jgi:hypothetical protein
LEKQSLTKQFFYNLWDFEKLSSAKYWECIKTFCSCRPTCRGEVQVNISTEFEYDQSQVSGLLLAQYVCCLRGTYIMRS